MIEIILKHKFLWTTIELQYIDNEETVTVTVFERLVQELQINTLLTQYFAVDKRNKIETLLTNIPAFEFNASNYFWNKIGDIIKKDEELLSLLEQKTEMLFYKSSGSKVYPIVQKLGEVLNIIQLRLYKILFLGCVIQNKPLSIDFFINTEYFSHKSIVEIYSSSTIIIERNAGIINISDETVSGIFLVSSNDIVIHGCLEANKICLFAEHNIINDGKIKCDSLFVCCNNFDNKTNLVDMSNLCSMTSFVTNDKIDNPNIKNLLINKGFYFPYLIQRQIISSDTYTKAVLSIYDHRGHNGNDHPNGLLKYWDGYFYMSKTGCQPSDDWIIFKICNTPIHPVKIYIHNAEYDSAIHTISIFMGSEQDCEDIKWYSLCDDIKNMKQGYRCSTESIIEDSLLLSDYFIYYHKLNLMKIKIIRNYGHAVFNSFCSFSLYGYCTHRSR
eukprot:256178_1